MAKEVCLARGDNLVLKVKVQGEPVTDKAWFWGRREIRSSGAIIITVNDEAGTVRANGVM